MSDAAQAEVWIVDIGQPGGSFDPIEDEHAWLAAGRLLASEREAVGKDRHALSRRQHLAGRVLARTQLARRLGVAPQRIGFGLAASGKPYAMLDGAALGVHFNISHSGERVALALADCQVGVDIECRASDVDAVALAKRFCVQAEAQWVESGGRKAHQRFGVLWALKEACLKMQGTGLAGGLNSLTFQRTGFRSLRACPVDPGKAPVATNAGWHCNVRVFPGYWAAVCTVLPGARTRWHQMAAGAL